MIQTNRILTAIVVIHLITNLLASVYLITFQLDAQRRSEVAAQQRAELKQQNDYLVCILLTQPEARTPEAISTCKAQTVDRR